jgi:putative transposase
MEDLNVKGMLKNHNLAKSIQELSLNKFKEMLVYKSTWYGRHLVQIDRWFPSSKLCHCCGYKNVNLKLSDRSWTCPECGEVHDRDLNAAINIKKEGQRILSITVTKGEDLRIRNKIGQSSPELTSIESSGYTLDEIEKKCINEFH